MSDMQRRSQSSIPTRKIVVVALAARTGGSHGPYWYKHPVLLSDTAERMGSVGGGVVRALVQVLAVVNPDTQV